MTEPSAAEFYRMTLEAKEQRELADTYRAALIEIQRLTDEKGGDESFCVCSGVSELAHDVLVGAEKMYG